jgi:hypothetical protein
MRNSAGNSAQGLRRGGKSGDGSRATRAPKDMGHPAGECRLLWPEALRLCAPAKVGGVPRTAMPRTIQVVGARAIARGAGDRY